MPEHVQSTELNVEASTSREAAAMDSRWLKARSAWSSAWPQRNIKICLQYAIMLIASLHPSLLRSKHDFSSSSTLVLERQLNHGAM